MEEKKTARQWCDEAVSYVRFRPDRSAIRRELTQHLMDSRFQLLDQGLDTETADARSVAAMGDPQTVGLALDRAHNPFLGWLWELSRLVCGILVFLALCCVLRSDWRFTVQNNLVRLIEPASVSQEPELDPDYGVADGTYRLLGEVGCPTPVQAGDYTLTVTTAFYREETENGQRSLTLDLTAQPRHFWMKEPALSSILMAVDSNGTVYSNARAPWISVWPLESDAGAYRFCVDFISIPGEPEWIQLQSSLDVSWSLRLELPEEVTP